MRNYRRGYEDPDSDRRGDREDSSGRWPGKRTLVEQVYGRGGGGWGANRGAESRGEPGGGRAGEALPAPVRAKMENSLGADFSNVRVHQGGGTAGAVLAHTAGDDIHFAPGRYDTSSPSGLELLGHELAHVVQQRAGRVASVQNKELGIATDDSLEREADRLGALAARGESARGAGDGTGSAPTDAPLQFKIEESLVKMLLAKSKQERFQYFLHEVPPNKAIAIAWDFYMHELVQGNEKLKTALGAEQMELSAKFQEKPGFYGDEESGEEEESSSDDEEEDKQKMKAKELKKKKKKDSSSDESDSEREREQGSDSEEDGSQGSDTEGYVFSNSPVNSPVVKKKTKKQDPEASNENDSKKEETTSTKPSTSGFEHTFVFGLPANEFKESKPDKVVALGKMTRAKFQRQMPSPMGEGEMTLWWVDYTGQNPREDIPKLMVVLARDGSLRDMGMFIDPGKREKDVPIGETGTMTVGTHSVERNSKTKQPVSPLGFSIEYKDKQRSEVDKCHFVQFVWSELIAMTPKDKKGVHVDGEVTTKMGSFPLAMSSPPTPDKIAIDGGSYYDTTGDNTRVPDSLTIFDAPSEIKDPKFVDKAWKIAGRYEDENDERGRVIFRDHFTTYLVKNDVPCAVANIDVEWELSPLDRQPMQVFQFKDAGPCDAMSEIHAMLWQQRGKK